MFPLNIYVASSQRNQIQPAVIQALRANGHTVYDYKQPAPGESGFAFSAIDPNWQSWTGDTYRAGLEHALAQQGFDRDFRGMQDADAFVLVLPCGRSAHLEAGWAIGRGLPLCVLLDGESEPDLMYKLANKLVDSIEEVQAWAREVELEGLVHNMRDTELDDDTLDPDDHEYELSSAYMELQEEREAHSRLKEQQATERYRARIERDNLMNELDTAKAKLRNAEAELSRMRSQGRF